MRRLAGNLLLFLTMLLLLAACGGDTPDVPTLAATEAASETAAPPPAEPTDTAEPENTAEPQATDTRETQATDTPAPRPTQKEPPTAAPTVAQAPELALAASTFTHSSGGFSLVPPSRWRSEESSGAASFDAPDGTGFIYVQITNTGYELDGQAFANFVTHRDLNFFDDFADYELISQEIDQSNGQATVTKYLTFDGVPQTVVTFYDQYGPIIYSYDFWADEEFFDAYDALYGEVLGTAEVDPQAAAEGQAEYLWVYNFTGPNDLFEIDVPTAWQYERTEDGTTIIDTFYAPDGHAVIQNITFDEGTELSRTQAAQLGREWLKDAYAQDMRFLDDRVQPDGSERLTWTSAASDMSGISFLEARGTTFLLFTAMYDNEFGDVYLETLEYTISSYTIPEP